MLLYSLRIGNSIDPSDFLRGNKRAEQPHEPRASSSLAPARPYRGINSRNSFPPSLAALLHKTSPRTRNRCANWNSIFPWKSWRCKFRYTTHSRVTPDSSRQLYIKQGNFNSASPYKFDARLLLIINGEQVHSQRNQTLVPPLSSSTFRTLAWRQYFNLPITILLSPYLANSLPAFISATIEAR